MSISIKVLNSSKQVAAYKIEQGRTLLIRAQDNVNYQLVDESIGFAPQNILVKRKGNDLAIMLDDGNLIPDIIIEDYYNDSNEEITNLLVGQHENGNFYAYVPQSGQKFDAVSLLAEEISTLQALGGKEISAFWTFNPLWLVAAIPLMAATTLAVYNSQNGEDDIIQDKSVEQPTITTSADGSITIKPGNDNVKQAISVIDNNVTQSIIYEKDNITGKWHASSTSEALSNVVIDQETGVITISTTMANSGSSVYVTSTDINGNDWAENITSLSSGYRISLDVGYDVFKQTTKTNNTDLIDGGADTDLYWLSAESGVASTANISNFEQILLAQDSTFSILSSHITSLSTPMKVMKMDNTAGQKVDFGQNNELFNDTLSGNQIYGEGQAGQYWSKQGSTIENSISYDKYQFNSSEIEVWVQQGISII